ncbi:MAG: autotransporter-associated beta strand repeat-containing protein, partial [Verrucomicrobiales bacterium]|nr:autotransporter-associated beta strand repeat-containing protein [Verrucomicrobiales bacterium]
RTVIVGGLLNIQGETSLGTPPASYVPDHVIIDGGRLNLARTQIDIHPNRGIYIGPNHGVLSVSSGQSPTNSAPITGPGSLTKSGTGNINLNSINTFAGDFIIEAGGVRFNTDAAAGLGKVIVNPTANVFLRNLDPLTPTRTTSITNQVIVNPGGGNIEFVVAQGDTFILSGPISGTAPLARGTTQTGNGGTLGLTGDNSAWSGGLWLVRGRVALGHKNALGTGTLLLQPAATGVNSVVLTAWTPLTGANAVAVPVTINVTNAATNALLNLGIGGTNALELSGPIALSSTNVPLVTPILNVTNTGGTIFSGNITGGAGVGLTKTGAETLTISGVGTYSGTTTVNGGTLLVNAPGSLASPVVVNTNAALGGSGTINGGVTVNAGGRIGAGTSAGTLTLGNGLNLSAGGTNVWELAANSTANPGSDFDQIILTGGNLVLGGSSALEIRFIGSATVPSLSEPFWQANRTWKIIALSGGSNPGNTVFATITGTNGITAGTFWVSADATGVYLNITTAATPPLLIPRITALSGAGTPSVTVHYTNAIPGTAYVLQYTTNLVSPAWVNVATNTATASTASQTDPTAAGSARRFYRVYFVTP